MKPELSIIFVYYNTPEEIIGALKSISQAVGSISYEVIIVDNASSSALPPGVFKFPHVTVIHNKYNLGYGNALNQGAKIAKGKYLLLCNPDVVFGKKSLSLLLGKLKSDPNIGIIGPQMQGKDKKVQQSISGFPLLPDAIFAFSFLNKVMPLNPFSKRYWMKTVDKTKEQEAPAVGGACMMVPKSVFEKVKGFDRRFFLYFEEADLCLQIKKKGYKAVYFPKAKIVHMVGRSNQNKSEINRYFEKSRFLFLKKYHGFIKATLAELFIRTATLTNISIFAILAFSLFLNLYKIQTLMMFFGDFGRDYLAARDFVLTGHIPLVGIQSSVVWLHQGPLSVYFIAIAFLISHFNPVAPAILYGVVGLFSTYLVYILGNRFFNKSIGILASLFYATSPFVLINTRMPYHTSPIPFFAGVFFLLLHRFLTNKKNIFLLFFSYGLLLQFELSNGVLVFVLMIIWFVYRPKFKRVEVGKAISGLLLGIAPFLIYDFTHRFAQTLGFPLWIVNRIRLAFGLTVFGNATTTHVPHAIDTIWQQISRIVFPDSQTVFVLILLLCLFVLFKTKKQFLKRVPQKGVFLTLLWLIVPIVGYSVHAAPGSAYFPLLFVPISLLVGYTAFHFISKTKFILVLFLALCFFNAFYTVKYNYFLSFDHFKGERAPGWNYSLGAAFIEREQAVSFIKQDAKSQKVTIKSGGFLRQFATGVDNYKYLLWYNGVKTAQNTKVVYTIYEQQSDVPKNANLVYRNGFVYVTKMAIL